MFNKSSNYQFLQIFTAIAKWQKITFFWVCEKLTLLVFLYENSQEIIFLMILYRIAINSNINYFLSYDLQILSQIDWKIWKSWILRKSGFCSKIVFLGLFELKKPILTPKKYLGVNLRGKGPSRKIDQFSKGSTLNCQKLVFEHLRFWP